MTLLLRNHCFQQVLIAPLMMAALERVYRELIDGDAVRDCLGLITGLILFGFWLTSLLILLAFFRGFATCRHRRGAAQRFSF